MNDDDQAFVEHWRVGPDAGHAGQFTLLGLAGPPGARRSALTVFQDEALALAKSLTESLTAPGEADRSDVDGQALLPSGIRSFLRCGAADLDTQFWCVVTG